MFIKYQNKLVNRVYLYLFKIVQQMIHENLETVQIYHGFVMASYRHYSKTVPIHIDFSEIWKIKQKTYVM